MPKLSTRDNYPQKNKNVTPPPLPKPKKTKKTGEVDLEIKV